MSRQKIFKRIPGSICAPRGFKCAAIFCDIKRIGTGKGSEKGQKRDLALIVSDVPSAVAGMFTTNKVCAAPVKLSAKRAARKFARAIVVNSGNANACTGVQGMRDARAMTELTARVAGTKPDDVLVCSTGRIGIPMPMKNIERGIRRCASKLALSARNARDVAEAIMTSDTRRKEISLKFEIGRADVRIGGICKGAGMIQPGMSRNGATTRRGLHATMLALLTTDVAIESSLLKTALEEAVEQSFNRITVDGDMSTNDSVIVLANGMARNSMLRNRQSPGFDTFRQALNLVTLELAKMIVRDGEGVSRFVTVSVRGARNDEQAALAARAVTNSSLVRTSWCGGDPNWGRILCAVGYSGAAMDEKKVDIGYSASRDGRVIYGFKRGAPTKVSLRRLARVTSCPEFIVHIDLHAGKGECTIYASDLTEAYVTFNKGDVSDPTSLGG